ncbi:MAG: hypothetical protein KDC38_09220, partial [Planctomycetes bacterium]|nr:hypothetical protein [Planctomycetota bacterium]
MNDPRLESRIAAALDGFRIPESVPKELNGALVPPPSEGAALRLIARTLHALLVRRPAETVVLVETVGGMEDPGVGWRVAADGWLGALPLDVPLRDELVQHFDE